jgi:hypothetical protein
MDECIDLYDNVQKSPYPEEKNAEILYHREYVSLEAVNTSYSICANLVKSPKHLDVLRSRVRATGIVENEFEIDGNFFMMFDVGGQRNERKKWIHCFENVAAVMFVAAISVYDHKLYEDVTTNRMVEALNLF